MGTYPYGTAAEEQGAFGPLAPDLVRSTTYSMPDAVTLRDIGEHRRPGEFYPRYGHPVGRLFEARIAALEGADGAVAFASGMAAFHAVFCGLLGSGDTLLCSGHVYGGLHALVREDLPRFGIRARYIDPFEPAALARTLEEVRAEDGGARRVLVHVESPINPICRVLDVRSLAEIAHAAGAWLSVDGTFLPPPFQRLLEQGADIVVHSATKFLGGHSDALGGIASSRHEILSALERFRRRTGAILAPDTAWLYCRSLATLELRVASQSATAARLADWLEEQRRRNPGQPIVGVHYPGLPGHPDHDLARRQMRCFGAMLLFELADLEAAIRVYDRFQRIARAISLGGVETISSLPLHTSHAGNSPEQLERAGIRPGMIRLSVGLEPFEEIRADLEQALRT